MNYQKAYCYFFNYTTDLINLLKSVKVEDEQVNVLRCLMDMQEKAEECCTADSE